MTISVIYEFVIYCRLISRLRHKYSYCKTVFAYIEQFEILLQVKFKKYGIP